MKLTSSERGFTLVELIVATALLAILTTLAIPLFRVSVKREKEREQAVGADNKPAKTLGREPALKEITTGHGRLSGGMMVFRDFQAADGTKGRIYLVKFSTLQDAQRQIDVWLKLAANVISRELDTKKDNVVISDRIVALGIGTPSEREFLIIRRNGLICYFVHAPSLQMAMRIEDTIG